MVVYLLWSVPDSNDLPIQVFVNAKGHLKLGGFLMGCDLSRPAEESVTPALSPLYCSPEALQQNTWSYASDLWSLGNNTDNTFIMASITDHTIMFKMLN